ncbi:Hypothetical protein RMP42_05934 (plasmid) [Roseomonas mucosa]|nr:Hypothetical protein RMP42_05934 [Roseomonas mucosa]
MPPIQRPGLALPARPVAEVVLFGPPRVPLHPLLGQRHPPRRVQRVPVQPGLPREVPRRLRAVPRALAERLAHPLRDGHQARRAGDRVQRHLRAVPAQVVRQERLIHRTELVHPPGQPLQVQPAHSAIGRQHHVGDGDVGVQLRVARHLQRHQLRVGPPGRRVGTRHLRRRPAGVVVEAHPADAAGVVALAPALALAGAADLRLDVAQRRGHRVFVRQGDQVALRLGRRHRPGQRHRLVGRPAQVDVADPCPRRRQSLQQRALAQGLPARSPSGPHVVEPCLRRFGPLGHPVQRQQPSAQRRCPPLRQHHAVVGPAAVQHPVDLRRPRHPGRVHPQLLGEAAAAALHLLARDRRPVRPQPGQQAGDLPHRRRPPRIQPQQRRQPRVHVAPRLGRGHVVPARAGIGLGRCQAALVVGGELRLRLRQRLLQQVLGHRLRRRRCSRRSGAVGQHGGG